MNSKLGYGGIMTKKIIKENITEIIRLYTEEYVTLQQLAQTYEKSRQYIKNILIKNGVKIRGKGLGRKPASKRYHLEEWCALYEEGKSISQIYELYKNECSRATILKYIRKTVGLKKFPVSEWICLYTKGKTLQEIEDIYGVSKNTISAYLQKNGIKIRTMNDYLNPKLKEDYFSVIDREAKAYFLGLLLTDGSVIRSNRRQAVIRLQLQSSDKYILEKFRKEIKLSANLHQDKRDGSWVIAIPSDKMAKDLEKYSCTERKTATVRLPRLKEEMMPHLIRGIIDGDGTIYKHKTKKKYAYISLCGVSPLVDDTRKYLIKKLNLSETKLIVRTKTKNGKCTPLYVMQWGGRKNVLKIGDWLYADAHFYLKRKYQKYLDTKTPC